VRGQPDLGKVAFADAPVDGIKPDGIQFAIHDGGGGGGGSAGDCPCGVVACSRAALAVAWEVGGTGGGSSCNRSD